MATDSFKSCRDDLTTYVNRTDSLVRSIGGPFPMGCRGLATPTQLMDGYSNVARAYCKGQGELQTRILRTHFNSMLCLSNPFS
jgi:hypothetical protein